MMLKIMAVMCAGFAILNGLCTLQTLPIAWVDIHLTGAWGIASLGWFSAVWFMEDVKRNEGIF